MGELFSLSAKEKKWLLKAARGAIGKMLKAPAQDPESPPERLNELKTGIFVTLQKRGNLRGCIGMIESGVPLSELVTEMAQAAAARDTRFTPVLGPELEEIDIEISVLGPPREISGPGDIVIGRDGLIIGRGPFRGLLLPQVATEWKWNKVQFLEHTCKKAGLNKDAWKNEDTRIYHFQAEVFGETERENRPACQ